MKIEITAGGIYDGKGVEIPVGTVLDVKKEPEAWVGRYRVLDAAEAKTGGKGGKGGKEAVTNPAKFSAVEKDGVWNIVDGDEKVIGKPLSEADAKDFNALNDADKAAFSAEHAKA